MAKEDKITELAMLFKQRDNPHNHEPCTAIVVQANPLILKVEDTIFLSGEYNNVCWSKSILAGYKRSFVINSISGVTGTRSGGGGDASFAGHDHDYKAPVTGTIEWTDSPQIGDEYIVIPISNGSMWYVFDKVVRP